jgi:hypothetical protein
MKTFFACVLLGITLVSLYPSTTFAYRTTNQSARTYAENTALYTITYRFGFLNREVYLPITTLRGKSTTSTMIGYDVLSSSTKSSAGVAHALVLSNAEIRDGMYYLPKGAVADFTFVSALSLPAGQSVADYAIRLNAVPFITVDDGERVNGAVQSPELDLYVTPPAKMNATLFRNDQAKVTDIKFTVTEKK